MFKERLSCFQEHLQSVEFSIPRRRRMVVAAKHDVVRRPQHRRERVGVDRRRKRRAQDLPQPFDWRAHVNDRVVVPTTTVSSFTPSSRRRSELMPYLEMWPWRLTVTSSQISLHTERPGGVRVESTPATITPGAISRTSGAAGSGK